MGCAVSFRNIDVLVDDTYIAQERHFGADAGDLLRQIALFKKLGFVIVRPTDSIMPLCDDINAFCEARNSCWRQNSFNFRRDGHWSMSSGAWWSCGGMRKFLEHPVFTNLCSSLMKDYHNRWHICKIAGDEVTPDCTVDQEVHSDNAGLGKLQYRRTQAGWATYGFNSCPALAISLAVHDIEPDMAPLLISSKEDHCASVGAYGPSVGLASAPLNRLALRKGTIVFRDIRLAHCGSRNDTSTTRYLPGALVCSTKMMFMGYDTGDHYRPSRTLPSALWYQMQREDSPIKQNLDYMYSNSL